MLMPLLNLTGRGVVLDVLAAGVWNKFDENDLQLLQKSPNFFSKCPGILSDSHPY